MLVIDWTDVNGNIRGRRRCSPENGDGVSDVDVGGVPTVLRLNEDIQQAPPFTAKTMASAAVAHGVSNEGDDGFPS